MVHCISTDNLCASVFHFSVGFHVDRVFRSAKRVGNCVKCHIFTGFHGVSCVFRGHGDFVFFSVAPFQGNSGGIVRVLCAAHGIGGIGINLPRDGGQVYTAFYFVSGRVFYAHGQGFTAKGQRIAVAYQGVIAICRSGYRFLQLCHVHRIGVLCTGRHTGDLAGDTFGRIAYGNGVCRRFPYARGVIGMIITGNIITDFAFFRGRHRTASQRYRIGYCCFCTLTHSYRIFRGVFYNTAGNSETVPCICLTVISHGGRIVTLRL